MNDRYIVFGPFVIGTSPLSVERNGNPVTCEHQKHKKWNPRSVKLLISLIQKQKQVVRASEIAELAYYGDRLEKRRNSFHKYISRLKCCLGDDLEQYLETVSRVADLDRSEGGYRFIGDAHFTNNLVRGSTAGYNELEPPSSTSRISATHIITADRIYVGHSGPINSTAVIDDRYVLSGSTDRTIRLWDAHSGECLHVFKGHTDAVSDIAVLANRRRFISSSWDGTLRLWDIDSRRCLSELKGHARGVCAVAVSCDNKQAVSGSADCTLRVWNLSTGKSFIFKKFAHAIYGVALTSDNHFVSASSGSSVTVWHMGSGKIFKTFEHSTDVHGVAGTKDDKHLITCLNDGAIQVWDVTSEQCLATLRGHSDVVWEAFMTPDSRYIFSCSADGSARMWDIAHKNVATIFENHGESANCISLMSNGQNVITGSDDGIVRLWHIPGTPSWVFSLAFRKSGLYDSSGREIAVNIRGDVKKFNDPDCCELNGGYVDIGKHKDLDSLQFFEIEAVITPQAVGEYRQNILEAQLPAIALFIDDQGRLVGSINTAKGWNNLNSGKTLIEAGTRTRVGFSRDNAGKMELQINGKIVAQKTVAGALQKVDDQGFRVGAWTDGKSYLFRGKIEKVTIGKI